MIAVVTAAGQAPDGGGLGAALCAALEGRGYSVVGWDADREALARTAAGVSLHGTQVLDRADPDAVERAFGALDPAPELVVNSLFDHASSRRRASFAEIAPPDLEEEIATALVGCAVVCLVAVRRMKSAGRGAIVNVTSAVAPFPAPLRLVEGAAAAGIESLTASLGAELAATGIRVNALAPAPELSGDAPLGEEPARSKPALMDEEVAALVAFLGSPEASAVNGAVVRADPGFDPFPGLR